MRVKSFLRIIAPLLLVVMLMPIGLSRAVHAQTPVEVVWATEWTDDATLNAAMEDRLVYPLDTAPPCIRLKPVQKCGKCVCARIRLRKSSFRVFDDEQF